MFDVKRSQLKSLDIGLFGADTRGMETRTEQLDHLDEMLVVWAREIPELDALTEGIVERIQILSKDFDRLMDETLEQFKLDRRAYHLLGRLRSYGPPYRRSPGQLATDMHISSGAMTNRLDRLEEAGLIRRLPDPSDRRGTLIEPTDAGHAAWDQTVGTEARREALVASVLSESERAELHRLLRHLMRAFDRPCDQHVHKMSGLAGTAQLGDALPNGSASPTPPATT
jgi:DNA-binding MarR family transcriptional regulator